MDTVAPPLATLPVTALPAPACLCNGDRVLITAGGFSGDYAHVVFVRPDGRYDLITESWLLLVAYPRHILRKVG